VAGTHLAGVHCPIERDPIVSALLDSGAPVIALSWSGLQCDEPVLTEAVRHLKARGREVIVRVQDPTDEPRAIEPFEALRYEVTTHSSFDGTTVSTATVAVRIGDLMRCETEDGTGPVDALERALRQCLYAIYPPVGDLQFASYSVESAGTYRGPAGLVRVTIEWSEFGDQWSTSAVSFDVLQAVWMALTDGFRLQLVRIIDHARDLEPEQVEMWAV
jgi:hypothetical protein